MAFTEKFTLLSVQIFKISPIALQKFSFPLVDNPVPLMQFLASMIWALLQVIFFYAFMD